MSMHHRLLALVVGSVLVVASCGDGGDTTVATPSTMSSTAADTPSSTASVSTAAPAAEQGVSAPTSSEPAAAEPPPATPPVATDPPATEVVEPLPDVLVHDVTAGTQVSLSSLLPADRPILLWMWAPH
jgi:hypothetical protein